MNWASLTDLFQINLNFNQLIVTDFVTSVMSKSIIENSDGFLAFIFFFYCTHIGFNLKISFN
jgi:hypothetical protein